MTHSFVLMTAMPVTKGHINLIDFASKFSDTVTVILCTQPEEPFVGERYRSLVQSFQSPKYSGVSIHNLHMAIPQEPSESTNFWSMWEMFLGVYGYNSGDFIIASETYGRTLAEYVGGTFIPYDLERSVTPIKATKIRENSYVLFDQMAPEFQKLVVPRVTLFGAESVGKTTLAKEFSTYSGTHLRRPVVWTHEYARPYLEAVGSDITEEKMETIWRGQAALQQNALDLADGTSTTILQDTDLFSTVGFWDMWGPLNASSTPPGLIQQAQELQSDLYVILPSNIPFEADPLRYGVDVRETSDEYWTQLCDRYDLNYTVLQSNTVSGRTQELDGIVYDLFKSKVSDPLDYKRVGNS